MWTSDPRLADGPDEVHRGVIARLRLGEAARRRHSQGLSSCRPGRVDGRATSAPRTASTSPPSTRCLSSVSTGFEGAPQVQQFRRRIDLHLPNTPGRGSASCAARRSATCPRAGTTCAANTRCSQSWRRSFRTFRRWSPSATDRAVMDVDFYVMDRIRGIILRSELPKGMTLTSRRERSRPASSNGLSICTRSIRSWWPSRSRRRLCATSDRRLDQALRRRSHLEHAELQESGPSGFVPHSGKAHYSNTTGGSTTSSSTWSPQQIIGVLDWETATIGDPLMEPWAA